MQQDNYGLSNLINKVEEMSKSLQPYYDALCYMQRDKQYAQFFDETNSIQLRAISAAISQNSFDKNLSRSVSEMLIPYQLLSSIQMTISALGNVFSSRVKNDLYSPIKDISSAITTCTISNQRLSNGLNSVINSTLMMDKNIWLYDKSTLANIDVSPLIGVNSAFATLCRLEQATASISSAPKNIISASTQIASICSSLKPNISFNSLIASTTILTDYCKFAAKQHELIQKSLNIVEINWRLDLLNAASKYVDRQSMWLSMLSEQIDFCSQSDERKRNNTEVTDSVISLIPQYVGYTKRKNVETTPTEGLEESLLVKITEKGKRITEGVITINKLQLDSGSERVFVLSETVVQGLLEIGSTVCTSEEQLGKIIDSLYFVFYENLEHIKVIIGNGDKEKGDELVRVDNSCQIVFDIKTLRSDYRHDLNHGSSKEQKKKLMNIGDTYRKYCGTRPIKEKDFKKLQSSLYDEIISFENWIIDLIVKKANDECAKTDV